MKQSITQFITLGPSGLQEEYQLMKLHQVLIQSFNFVACIDIQ